jgi:hypothetical protein
MPSETEVIGMSVEDRTRQRLGKIIDDLRESAKNVGQSPRGRAINIAITEMEKVSMVVIRSFYADEPYDPRKKLQPKV